MVENNASEKFARFIAHVQGDGCFSPERNLVRYFNQEMDLINDFKESAEKCFEVSCNKVYAGRTCFHIGFRNKRVADLIKEYSFGSETWFVPKFVFEGSQAVIASYLQAFFDDEGSAIFQKRELGYDRAVQMQSINGKGLLQLRDLLKSIGIVSNFHGPYKLKYFELKITGKENLKEFFKKVGFVHKRKMKTLEKAIETYLK